MRIAFYACLIVFITISIALSGQAPQETAVTPDEAKQWSDTIGYIFDQWWDRVLLVLSMLANLGLLTRGGQDLANKLNPLQKKK